MAIIRCWCGSIILKKLTMAILHSVITSSMSRSGFPIKLRTHKSIPRHEAVRSLHWSGCRSIIWGLVKPRRISPRSADQPSVPTQKYVVCFVEKSMPLTRRADDDILPVFRGGPTQSAAWRAGETDNVLLSRDTGLVSQERRRGCT